MIRDNTSRPKASVPSQCTELGGLSCSRKLVSYGSNGAITPARKAIASIRTTTTAPAKPSVRLRANDTTAPNQVSRAGPGSHVRRRLSGTTAPNRASLAILRIADPRIEKHVQHVDHEVGDNEGTGDQHDQCLGHRVVAPHD